MSIFPDKTSKEISDSILDFIKNISIIFAVIIFSNEKIEAWTSHPYIKFAIFFSIITITLLCGISLFLSITKACNLSDESIKKSIIISRTTILIVIIVLLLAIFSICLWIPFNLKKENNETKRIEQSTTSNYTTNNYISTPLSTSYIQGLFHNISGCR